MVQTPPPPSITPRQMNLLRIVTAMAWSDGELAQEEVDVMLDRFSGLFATEATQQQQLRQELRDYMMQNIPLEELTAKLQTQEERELVLRLGYEVICSSARTPDEDNINDEEAAAYQKLVDLLGLSPETAQRVIAEAEEILNTDENLIDSLTRQLQQFMQ
ncbi:tellurite resistance TerB family protein [Thermocoleostomius sinensis]|uniref:TerB family tellurite resistance protein n=1 Tax=Thermocoleostomius sinensis A174 TaxID=2016057 RepID=A0A9E8ZFA6_9CYAN|nr:TerB family tellurite resistance protein [Thermocoleostomius sinensis]WAL62098.1 TerB family tellurite resistance protein [Thermocoleostomius sinensis A174]